MLNCEVINIAAIIGYSFYGQEVFSDDSTSLTNINYADISNAIINELDIKKTSDGLMVNSKDVWNSDQVMIAKFNNSLEGGNIGDNGVKIVGFKLLRRLASETDINDILLKQYDYIGGDADFSYTDVTQSNSNLLYSIVPVGENGLDGTVREINIDNTNGFTGWWIVDKDTSNVLPFDKALGSVGNVDGTLNQDRTVIDTFNQYAQVYYGSKQYHTFSLSTVLIPDEGQNSSKVYLDMLGKFINLHKPLIVKAANGMTYVCDIGNVRFSTPLNTWNGYDPLTITIDCVETADYKSFVNGG